MAKHSLAVCLDNEGYKASLDLRKIYETLPEPDALKHDQIRVVDESGGDYLYPDSFFEVEAYYVALEQLGFPMQSRALLIERAHEQTH